MATLESITKGSLVKGIVTNQTVSVVDVKWHGNDVVDVFYKDPAGKADHELLFRDQEDSIEIVEAGANWSFSGDGNLFRIAMEAMRIRMAYLFDPMLAVHTSQVLPLPHQITAVYEEMLPRQPLRFLLADDPGAGKTIMSGLLIKELIARGDLQRCMIVAPGVLVEQWQTELWEKFSLKFDILTNDQLNAAPTGNWFHERNLIICRLDKLSRNDEVQDKIKACDWDLIICDEAHKMSATYFGGEVDKTKRYRLGEMLSNVTRNFLLLTATPHNGKETDFQLFMRLIDGDRFEGEFRDGIHQKDAGDLMRRMVKERLFKFDGTRLFPERRAYTVPYTLSDAEDRLYKEVTDYVTEEFNRADRLGSDKRKGTVGFALTSLQRRLASSPEAIYQSLRRRKERLERRVREEEQARRGASAKLDLAIIAGSDLDDTDPEEFDDLPDAEREATEERLIDEASAAQTIGELKKEIETLGRLEALALIVRQSGQDRKWEELSKLLQNQHEMFDPRGARRKLIIFTEHRDTLNYLRDQIGQAIDNPEAVVTIQGGMGRQERKKAQDFFTYDKDALILVATDAAGEGVNLQCAHLMVNYDLPWNPNRIEQRFGRIHRIGQLEVCHLWNLVAHQTREGQVFQRLLEKLEEARQALKGEVYDVLGQLVFGDEPLWKLLVKAVRYGDDPERKKYLSEKVDGALDVERIKSLIRDRALTDDAMDVSAVYRIREDMERAEARRLQPHFVESFFLRAFQHLGGTISPREPRRYEIKHVPAAIRKRERDQGGNSLLTRYARVTFEKDLIKQEGKDDAAFLSPGNPLLDSVISIISEQYRDLLKQGTVLVDELDEGTTPRLLFGLEHDIRDGRSDGHGNRRIVSKRFQFVELSEDGTVVHAGSAPYLDYRALREGERSIAEDVTKSDWLRRDLEQIAVTYAIGHLVPEHFEEIRDRREHQIDKTRNAVHARLTSEINYWDNRALELRQREEAGQQPKLNSNLARQRRDELVVRLENRMLELEQERKLSRSAPNITAGALILPIGLFSARGVGEVVPKSHHTKDTKGIELLAMEAVFAKERSLGCIPIDVSAERRGYDIESQKPDGGLRFIEVKGRVIGSDTVTVTRNEVLTALNKPEDFILAIVEVDGVASEPIYISEPFSREPDFGVTCLNYKLQELLAKSSR
jgi:superfamily II DNA or RNA helicase